MQIHPALFVLHQQYLQYLQVNDMKIFKSKRYEKENSKESLLYIIQTNISKYMKYIASFSKFFPSWSI